ncbi:asparagine synthase-related protein [Rhodohalobacter sp. 614A]|uniref:asparagine synthase-related protein n=1 Tax=Rhodohalobacter sp. 614A TaxID=2908649 RepID=UPI001F368D04|nr:asparagine synthase-related protein [Rhodohalobacter sp. 614A]
MNLWIAKLGMRDFKTLQLEQFQEIAHGFWMLKNAKISEYKTEHLHYLSYRSPFKISKKRYSDIGEKLLGYSGLILPILKSGEDFGDIATFLKYEDDLPALLDNATGQFSLFKASVDYFECITDNLGAHKIYYCEQDNGTVYVSNFLPMIRAGLGSSNPNYNFFVDWIAAGGNYGYATEEKDIFNLPEYGRLTWSASNGLEVSRYHDISRMIIPAASQKKYINECADHLSNAIHYLSKTRQSVLTLSGGYDSRLILSMFHGLPKESLECYTYPDHIYDMSLARKAAGKFGFPHTVLRADDMPDVYELDEFIQEDETPYWCYSNVFRYLFKDKIRSLLRGGQKVLLRGDAGGTPHPKLKKFSELRGNIEFLVDELAMSMLNLQILTPDAKESLSQRFRSYYVDKYGPFFRENLTLNLAVIQHYFERFRQYQTGKLIHHTYDCDLFLPYGNETYIQTTFNASTEELYRYKNESIHHQLYEKFTGGKISSPDFTTGVHWDANNIQKIKYQIERKVLQPRFKPDVKYTSKIRAEFFNTNLDYFREIVRSSSDSDIWHFFDRKQIESLLKPGDESHLGNMKVIFRIIPLLKRDFSFHK